MSTIELKKPVSTKARGPKGRGNVGRDAVMKIATQMFLRYGYHGTSMKALANELGVSAPAIYWYFPSKEDLYVEVLETSMRDFSSTVQSAATSTDPTERLEQFVRAHVTWQLDQSDAARTFDLSQAQVEDIPVERLASVKQMQVEYRNQIRDVLRAGQNQGAFSVDNINVTAFAILTLCEYVYSWFNPQGQLSISEVADHMVKLVQNMVGFSSHTEKPN